MAINRLLNFDHARTKEQSDLMKKIEKDMVCPFCWENLEKYHPEPIIKKGFWWLITKNAFPYKGTLNHFLLIYKYHVAKISMITPQASTELLTLLSWLEKKYKIKGGGVFMRFGETQRNGSSVEHLHLQLVQGNSKKSIGAKTLKVKLGYFK
jgi:diadenosine tetraphosphate (Ap4A) HIT family hydrolase